MQGRSIDRSRSWPASAATSKINTHADAGMQPGRPARHPAGTFRKRGRRAPARQCAGEWRAPGDLSTTTVGTIRPGCVQQAFFYSHRTEDEDERPSTAVHTAHTRRDRLRAVTTAAYCVVACQYAMHYYCSYNRRPPVCAMRSRPNHANHIMTKITRRRGTIPGEKIKKPTLKT